MELTDLITSSGLFLNATVKTPLVDTTKYFQSWYYFIIPVLLIGYSYFNAKAAKDWSEKLWIEKVKVLYYPCFALFYIIMLKAVNLIGISGKIGILGISPKAWSLIVFTLVTFIVAVIIDIFVISGYSFKEFGIFGAKFIKEDTKQTVIDFSKYILQLESSIMSTYDRVDDIKQLFLDETIIDKIQHNRFNFLDELSNVLYNFYSNRNEIVNIDIYLYEDQNILNTLNRLNIQFNFTEDEIKVVKNCLEQKTSRFLEKKDYNLFVITAISGIFPNKTILITVKSLDDLSLFDQFLISNLIYQFDLELALLRKSSNKRS